jgi:hypothetical protein
LSRAEENRAAMPLAAEMVAEIRATCPGAKVLWVKEGERELGKRPALESNLFEISAETFDLARKHATYFGSKKR